MRGSSLTLWSRHSSNEVSARKVYLPMETGSEPASAAAIRSFASRVRVLPICLILLRKNLREKKISFP